MFSFLDVSRGENHDVIISYRKPKILKLIGEGASIVVGGAQMVRDFNIPNWFHVPHFRTGEYPTVMIQGVLGPKFISNTSQRIHRENGIDCVNIGPTLNIGPLITSIEDLENELFRLFEENGGEKIIIDAHSLGGIYAIYLAEHFPHMVKCLILRGVPCGASAKELRSITHLSVLHEAMKLVPGKFHSDFIDDWKPMSEKPPLQMPVFVMVARNDGVIDPHSCFMPKNKNTKHAILECTHFDLIAKEPINQYASAVVKHGINVEPPECVKEMLVPDTHHLHTFTFAFAS